MNIFDFCKGYNLPPPNISFFKSIAKPESLLSPSDKETYTFTFSEGVENHVGGCNK